MKWKIISTEQKYKNKWMTVTEDVFENVDGKRLTYGVVRKEPCALIIPWDGKVFTLVGQYRHPNDYFSWEFPQGHLEHGSVEKTAIKELKEETGLTAEKIEQLAHFYLAPGHHTQEYFVFLATGLREGKQELEESEEGMVTKKIAPRELEKMISDGLIKDGPTLAACGLLKIKWNLKT